MKEVYVVVRAMMDDDTGFMTSLSLKSAWNDPESAEADKAERDGRDVQSRHCFYRVVAVTLED